MPSSFKILFLILLIALLGLASCFSPGDDHGEIRLPGGAKRRGDAEGIYGFIAGSLDPTYGDRGKTLTQVGSSGDGAKAVTIDSDERIIAVGFTTNQGSEGSDFVTVRYDGLGRLDKAFGSEGKVTRHYGGDGFDVANTVLVSGRTIFVGGTRSNGINVGQFLVALTDSGAFVPGFGGENGFSNVECTLLTTGGCDLNGAVVREVNGETMILAVGTWHFANGYDDDSLLTQYHASDGRLDENFGIGGKLRTDIERRNNYGNALVLSPEGMIYVAGSVGNYTNDVVFALERHRPDGSLDPSFGNRGIVLVDFGTTMDVAQAVALQSDGKILVAGDTGAPRKMGISRHLANGLLDETFGVGGKVTFDLGGDGHLQSMVVQSDGKIVLSGEAQISTGAGFLRGYALARLNADGTPDPLFGINGITVNVIDGGTQIGTAKVALQPDGKKLVVAGQARPQDGNLLFSTLRFLLQ